jgi:DNA repair protein SbcD/Mre11
MTDDSSWKDRPSSWTTPAGTFRIGLIGAGAPVRWEGSTPLPAAGPGVSTAAAKLVGSAIEHGVNYLALGEGAERFTLHVPGGLAHDPGSPQGLNAGESGAKGCSLIEVISRGQAEIKFLPTGGVRWMSLTAEAPPSVDIDQLAERMALVAMESEPHPTDDLWLTRWTIRGTAGQWASALADARTQADLWDKLERELGSVGGPRRRHSLDAIARPILERRIDREPGERDLYEDFCEQIDEDALQALEAFKAEMNSPEWASRGWVRHVRQALQRTTSGDIARRARSMGESWLG